MSEMNREKGFRIAENRQKRNAFLIILGIIIVMYLFSLPCPILFMTGIPCPGCGMTRACLHLLQLDFAGAFQYHPLCFFLPLFVGVFLFRRCIPRKAYTFCVIIVISSFFLTYFLRLFDPTDTLVKIKVSNGLFYRIYSYFK